MRSITVAALLGGLAPLGLAEDHAPARGDYGIALQPFFTARTTNRSKTVEPIQVAYYVPTAGAAVRAVPVAPAEPSRVAEEGKGPIVNGSSAVLHGGIAYAPSRAPAEVKSAIWAANTLHAKPYRWGGGHASFYDHGYDCSGAVSFALHNAGLLSAPLPSNEFQHFGERGRGRWITIYSRRGHTFAVIAGLRFDTTDIRDGDDVGPRWYADGRDTRDFEARHPVGL